MRVTIPAGAFFHALGEILRDERRCYFAFLGVMTLKALSYWIVFGYLHPNAAMDDLLFFRRNDIEYFQLVVPFSRFDFSSFSTIEHHGSGLIAVPLLQAMPYAMSYALMGTWGIVVADVLISIATFLFFVWLLVELEVPMRLAKYSVLALLVAEITLTKFLRWHVGYGYELASFWDLRFPKPFVSFPLLLWTILWMNHLWRRRETLGPRLSVVSGVTFGALIQTDVFRGFPMHLLLAAVAPLALIFAYQRKILGQYVRFGALFAITYVITIGPFVAQRLNDTPDFIDRMGFNVLDRFSPPFLYLQDVRLGAAPVLLFCVYLIYCAIRRRLATIPSAACILAAGAVCAYFSMPAMVIIRGSIAQSFHFVDALHAYASLLFLFLVLRSLSFAARGLDLGAWISRYSYAFSCAVLASLAAYALFVPVYDANRRQVQVQNYRTLLSLNSYREDAIELRKDMRAGQLAKAEVIGTFDPHVAFYALYRGKHVYLPDAGMDVVGAKEQLDRLLSLCVILNLPEEDVAALVGRSDVHLYWGTVIKYNVERFRKAYALEEYEGAQKEWAASDTLDFNVLIPRFVIRELVQRYRELKQDVSSRAKYRLDAIVLARTEDTRNARPDSGEWKPGLENATFRSWTRRELPRPGSH